MPLQKSQLDSAFQANVANVIRKLQKGKTLTRAEQDALRQSAAMETRRYAQNKVELAEILGVTRQGLHAWMKMAGAPKADSGGRYDAQEWMAWRDERGLKGSETSGELEEKARAIRLRNEDLELDIAIKRGEWVEIATLVELLGRFGADQKRLFVQKLEKEWPAKFPKELQAMAREEGRKLADELCRRLQGIVDALAAKASSADGASVTLDPTRGA